MFTENQSRQLYVVNSVVAANADPVNAGDIKMKETADNKEFFFNIMGATDDGLQRSDLVDKCNIMDIRATAADDMKQSGKQHQQHVAGNDLQPEGLIQLSEEIQESHKQRQNRNQISAEAEDSHEETVDGQADDSQRILQKDSQRQKENHQHNQRTRSLQ